MTGHLSFETMHDLLDDILTAEEGMRANAHLQACAACKETLGELSSLRAHIAALPREVKPPDALWADVRATLASSRRTPGVRMLGFQPASRRSPGPGHWAWATPGRLAAAAVLLVAISSAITMAVVRSNGPQVAAIPAGPSTLTPVSWETTARGYQASVDDMRAQLDAQRGLLSPATIAAVERSLATIDQAIAEAREALQRDPSNAALNELMASNYRQKVELLRRATQLTATS